MDERYHQCKRVSCGRNLFLASLSTFIICRIVDDNTISVNGKNIRIVSSRNPLELPWKEMVSLYLAGFSVSTYSIMLGAHPFILYSW